MVLLFASFLSLLTTVYGLTLSLQQVNNWSTSSTDPTSAPTSTAASSTAGSTSTAALPVSSAPAAVTVPHWGQCGGLTWSGPTVCGAPFTCTESSSPYYWECL
ncbi:carbohydrate-binding module family 1 protein [Sphaerobolus stellatus SS14]|uniref:Carbohydrate-binding module family 1 protein n=1 Tax=Sphaerobolus stellatus (strain SS14) TaxID=990650 RepID=A0A0C9VF03_SPHS4|nr:carbohydrate-binding module family 1 protein [Sphaerobolus stellatus SS14]